MAEFSASFTVEAVPVINGISPLEHPNIRLQLPSSAVINLTPSPPTDATDTFVLSFVANESEVTFMKPPWVPRLLEMPDGVAIGTENPSSTKFDLKVEVEKGKITEQLKIPFYICTNIGIHDPSIAIDPPPPQ